MHVNTTAQRWGALMLYCLPVHQHAAGCSSLLIDLFQVALAVGSNCAENAMHQELNCSSMHLLSSSASLQALPVSRLSIVCGCRRDTEASACVARLVLCAVTHCWRDISGHVSLIGHLCFVRLSTVVSHACLHQTLIDCTSICVKELMTHGDQSHVICTIHALEVLLFSQ